MIGRTDIENLESTLPEDPGPGLIERTARELESLSYEPLLIIPVDGFIRMGREDFLQQCRFVLTLSDAEVADLPVAYTQDPERIRQDQLRLLVSQYDLLVRLRRDEPEAWDEVHELYEDD
jgi:hypothetical protein